MMAAEVRRDEQRSRFRLRHRSDQDRVATMKTAILNGLMPRDLILQDDVAIAVMAADLGALRRSHADLEKADLLKLGWEEAQIRALWPRALQMALSEEQRV